MDEQPTTPNQEDVNIPVNVIKNNVDTTVGTETIQPTAPRPVLAEPIATTESPIANQPTPAIAITPLEDGPREVLFY